jgi:hypothetical protein
MVKIEMPMEQTHEFKKGFIVGVVAGIVGAFALQKKRRLIMGKLWKLKVQADIHRRVGALKRLTRENYDEIIEDALTRYRAVGSIAKSELDEFGRELKRKWKEVKAEFEEAADDLEDEKG